MSTPSRPVTLLTMVGASEFVYPRQHTVHFFTGLDALFLQTRRLSRLSSSFLTPRVSAAFTSSAGSSFIPDTSVLTFHDQLCHWSAGALPLSFAVVSAAAAAVPPAGKVLAASLSAVPSLPMDSATLWKDSCREPRTCGVQRVAIAVGHKYVVAKNVALYKTDCGK